MDEDFLHYIWKFQKLNGELHTTEGEAINVIEQGTHNNNSGPDFEEAKIQIGDILWAGKIEIHVNASDWINHKHHIDDAYSNVILHVVWKNNQQIVNGHDPIPTLELESYIDKEHYAKYLAFQESENEILCASQIRKVPSISIRAMKDRMAVERLEKKAMHIVKSMVENENDWSETTYQALATNFGFSVNKEAFTLLSKKLPYKIVSKYLGKMKSVEALVFGQAGFLGNPKDGYQEALLSEFDYLKKKHHLKEALRKQQWKFSKMRPSNFPTVRLAQFAALVGKKTHLFSRLIEGKDVVSLIKNFQFKVTNYWTQHYDFNKKSGRMSGKLGMASFNSLLINAVAPLLAAYSKYVDNQEYMDRAIHLLESIPAEHNRIIRKWEGLCNPPKNAFDTQSLLGLYNDYCSNKKCLQCSIGIEILAK